MAETTLFTRLQVLALIVQVVLVTLNIALDANSDQIAVSVEPKLEDNDYFGDESPGEIKTEGHGKRDPTIGLFFKRDQETWLGNMKMKSRKKPDYKRKDHRRNTDEAKIKKRIISHEPDSTC